MCVCWIGIHAEWRKKKNRERESVCVGGGRELGLRHRGRYIQISDRERESERE